MIQLAKNSIGTGDRLAEGGGKGLDAVKYVYRQAYQQNEALCQPYAAVIDIEFAKPPHPDKVDQWRSGDIVAAIRHEPDCRTFDRNFRQLLHVGFKIAVKMGDRYTKLLDDYEAFI